MSAQYIGAAGLPGVCGLAGRDPGRRDGVEALVFRAVLGVKKCCRVGDFGSPSVVREERVLIMGIWRVLPLSGC